MNKLHRITAKKEVILSAGAIGTPQLLLNSGIGGSSDLTAIGIKALVDLPDVGKNLSDHPAVGLKYRVNTTDTWDDLWRNQTMAAEAFQLWKTKRTGPLADTLPGHIMWSRLPDEIVQKYSDPASGPNSPHIEMSIQVSDLHFSKKSKNSSFTRTVGISLFQLHHRANISLTWVSTL